jgi:WD40 repeat protein
MIVLNLQNMAYAEVLNCSDILTTEDELKKIAKNLANLENSFSTDKTFNSEPTFRFTALAKLNSDLQRLFAQGDKYRNFYFEERNRLIANNQNANSVELKNLRLRQRSIDRDVMSVIATEEIYSQKQISPFYKVLWSDDSKYFVTASSNEILKRSVLDGRLIFKIKNKDFMLTSNSFRNIYLSKDDKYLIIDFIEKIGIFDFQNGDQVGEWIEISSIDKIILNSQAKILIVTELNRDKINFINLDSALLLPEVKFPSQVKSIDVSTNGEQLIVNLDNGAIQIIDIQSRNVLFMGSEEELVNSDKSSISKLILRLEGKYLIIKAFDRKNLDYEVKVLDWQNGQFVFNKKFETPSTNLLISNYKDGKPYLLIGEPSKSKIEIVNLENRKIETTIQTDFEELVLNTNSDLLIWSKSSFGVYNLATGKEVYHHENPVESKITKSSNYGGRFLALAYSNGDFEIHDLVSHTLVITSNLHLQGEIQILEFSKNNQYLIIGSEDANLKLIKQYSVFNPGSWLIPTEQ